LQDIIKKAQTIITENGNRRKENIFIYQQIKNSVWLRLQN